MGKEDVVYLDTYECIMEYYSAIQKNEILPFATTWMELESIMLSQSVRQGQIPYDFTHMWNVRNKIDEHKEGEKEGGKS